MASHERHKNTLRLWIRVAMVFIVAVLLLFSVGVPTVNNAIALSVENDLKNIPLPEKTELHNEYDVGYYIVYSWGSAPDWLQDWLNIDLRGH